MRCCSAFGTLSMERTLTIRLIGGIIDMYIFHESDPEYIVRKYHSVIGRPLLTTCLGYGITSKQEEDTHCKT